MNMYSLPDGALQVLLKEYESLRDEIKERLKTAFSHVAYVGAIVAFAVPAAGKAGNYVPQVLSLTLALAAALFLALIALVNWRWVDHCACRLRVIETRVNAHFGQEILHWEHYAETVKASFFMLLPEKANRQSRENDGDHLETNRSRTEG